MSAAVQGQDQVDLVGDVGLRKLAQPADGVVADSALQAGRLGADRDDLDRTIVCCAPGSDRTLV
jgi:hypothetical protein